MARSLESLLSNDDRTKLLVARKSAADSLDFAQTTAIEIAEGLRCPECGDLPCHVRELGMGLRAENGYLLIFTDPSLHTWRERVL